MKLHQKSSRKIGALLVTYQGIMTWVGLISFVTVVSLGWSTWQGTILSVLPWFNLAWCYVAVGIIVVIMGLIQYLLFQPSIQAYSNSQEYLHKSPQQIDHALILENQKKIMKKLEIE